jgi:hypothetical protein
LQEVQGVPEVAESSPFYRRLFLITCILVVMSAAATFASRRDDLVHKLTSTPSGSR